MRLVFGSKRTAAANSPNPSADKTNIGDINKFDAPILSYRFTSLSQEANTFFVRCSGWLLQTKCINNHTYPKGKFPSTDACNIHMTSNVHVAMNQLACSHFLLCVLV